MNSFGQLFRITLWGESHGPRIGVSIDGVPPGIPLTESDFEQDLARRQSGAPGTTLRRERDRPRLVSGIYGGFTTGAPVTVEFTNEDADAAAYPAAGACFRPSHADRTAFVRYAGWNDPRGGGMFSGRLTVALVAAGVVAKKCLPGLTFDTRPIRIGGCADPACFAQIAAAAAAARDSVGGVIECRIEGVPAGWGEPFFDSAESLLSHLLFAIPAVKGVEFGDGFAAADRSGSERNDLLLDADGGTATNHEGGINGGLTNGNGLVFRVAVKPAPSIGTPQPTYDPASGTVRPLTIRGRHDACIALRAAVVIEAAAAIVLTDLTMRRR